MDAFFKITCPACSGNIEVPNEIRGQAINCPHCNHAVLAQPPVPPIAPPPFVSTVSPSRNLKLCPDCRTPVSKSAPICPQCGRQLRRRNRDSVLGCLAIVVILFVIAFVLGSVFVTQSRTALKEIKTEATKKAPVTNSPPSKPALSEAENQRAAALLNSFKLTKDEFRDLEFYKAPMDESKSHIRAYIGKAKTGSVFLRFYVYYEGDDWIFFDKCLFKIGDKTLSFLPDDVKRDHQSGSVWEWADELYNDHKELLQAINNASGPVKIRYAGKYNYDREVSERELESIRQTILVYRYLGGEW